MLIGRFTGLAALVAAAVVLVGAAPAAAGGSAQKRFAVVVAPASVPAGTTATFTVTVRNLSVPQRLGSADVTLPAAFALRGVAIPAGAPVLPASGSTVRLRDLALAPGAALSIRVVADVPCAAGPALHTWTAAAKQANRFHGSGNDVVLDRAASALTTTVTGSCSLRFVTQPRDALVGQPQSPPVAVEIVGGDGTRAATSAVVTLSRSPLSSGTGAVTGGTATAVQGLATFPALAVGAPGVYGLQATSPGLAPATSAFFRVAQETVPCPPGQSCTATAASPTGTSASATAAPAPGETKTTFLSVSFNAGAPLECPAFTPLTPPSDTVLVESTSTQRAKTATLRIPAALIGGGRSYGHKPRLDLCFGSPEPFRTASGATAQPRGTYDWNADGVQDPVYAGLLPECRCARPPCVKSRYRTPAGDGVIVVAIPGGLSDPKMRG
jgi:hypothetical protein